MLFREDQGGYLAGVMAASLSKSGVIGVVGGREDVPPVVRYVNAYKTGAESVNPDIRVLSTYNESFTDPNKGASDAQQFMGEGADVVFGAGGQTGSGGVAAAAQAGKWAIGVDQDEYFTTFNGGDAPGFAVPRHLGDQAGRPLGLPQHRRGDRTTRSRVACTPSRRPTTASPTPRSTTRTISEGCRVEDGGHAGRVWPTAASTPVSTRSPDSRSRARNEHVEHGARALRVRGPVFAWQGLTQP